MLLNNRVVSDRERERYFRFRGKKKERKKETLFRPSIDEIPLYLFYLFPLSVCNIILLDNQLNNQLHYNKTLYYTMLASTSGGALFPLVARVLFPFDDFYLVDDLFSVFLKTKRRRQQCHRHHHAALVSNPIPRRSPLGRRPKFYNS